MIKEKTHKRIFELVNDLEQKWCYGSPDRRVEIGDELKILDLAIKMYRAEQEDAFQYNFNYYMAALSNILDEISEDLKNETSK